MNLRITALATGVVAVALLTGCHSGKSAAGAPVTTATNPTTAAATDSSTNSDSSTSSDTSSDGSATPAAATGGAIQACKLVPLAQVAILAKQPYTSDSEQDQGTQAGCAYDNDDATATGVNITVYRDGIDELWSTVHTGNIDELSGVGDAAFWDQDNTVYAKAKGLMVQINGLDDKDASVALAKAVTDALP